MLVGLSELLDIGMLLPVEAGAEPCDEGLNLYSVDYFWMLRRTIMTDF